ncbi:MAG: hypothetical protein WDO19_29095 [Bacteroidota bacterium]
MSIYSNSIDKIYKLTALVLLVMTGVLLPGKNYGQDDQLKSLEKKIRDNNPAFASEKLFVHTDKSFYQPDEIIWMKLYVTDAITHRPLDISKLAYAELINENGESGTAGQDQYGIGAGQWIIRCACLSSFRQLSFEGLYKLDEKCGTGLFFYKTYPHIKYPEETRMDGYG